jgi:hypothetical protein
MFLITSWLNLITHVLQYSCTIGCLITSSSKLVTVNNVYHVIMCPSWLPSSFWFILIFIHLGAKFFLLIWGLKKWDNKPEKESEELFINPKLKRWFISKHTYVINYILEAWHWLNNYYILEIFGGLSFIYSKYLKLIVMT